MPEGMPIGKVAKATGLSIDAIRFYEKAGLLKEPPRSHSGYRLFGPEAVHDLQFIAQAQALGFSLREIRELLLVRNTQAHACAQVRDLIQRKLATVREKINELLRLESGLQQALRKCQRELRRSQTLHPACCPVLQEIEQANGGKKSIS